MKDMNERIERTNKETIRLLNKLEKNSANTEAEIRLLYDICKLVDLQYYYAKNLNELTYKQK